MKTVLLVHAAQISASNMALSVAEFIKATWLDAGKVQTIAFMQGAMPIDTYKPELLATIQRGAIYQYKIGRITSDEFIAAMNKAFVAAGGRELSPAEMMRCWNAMCTMSPETFAQVATIAKLQAQNKFGIHVIASSNTMHDEYISQQLRATGLHLSYTNSFNNHTLDKAALLEHAKADIAAATEVVEVIDLRDDDKRPLVEVVQEVLKEACAEEMAQQASSAAAPAAKQHASSFTRFTAAPAVAAGSSAAARDGSDEDDEAIPALPRVKTLLAQEKDLLSLPEESGSERDPDEQAEVDRLYELRMSMLHVSPGNEVVSAAAAIEQPESALVLFQRALADSSNLSLRALANARALKEFGEVCSPRTALEKLRQIS